jgi:hypothetical protein
VSIPPANNQPVDNQQIINKIDDFIAGLNAPPGTTIATSVVTKTISAAPAPAAIVPPSTDEEMKAFILKHSAQLVETGIQSIMELQKVAIATGNAELVASLAALIAANTGAIETVNKLHILNKKFEVTKALKAIDMEGKRELQKLKNEGYLNLPASNTNILVATREEIMAQLTGKAKVVPMSKDAIEVETISSLTLSAS